MFTNASAMTTSTHARHEVTSIEVADSSESKPVWRFDHVSVSMGADHALRTLFEGVMGFENGFRPPFPFPGRWLYEGDQAVVHGISDPTLSAEFGELRFNHIAFKSEQCASEVLKQLRQLGLPHTVARVPQENITQIFVRMPGGLVIELDVPDDTEVLATHHYRSTQSAPTAEDF